MMATTISANKHTFHIITFGCQMNVRDSRWLAAAMKKHDFVEASEKDAEIVIINTCSVREKPQQKLESCIGRIRGLSQHKAKIAVLGCVAEQLGASLLKDDIILIANSDYLDKVPATLLSYFSTQSAGNLTGFAPVFRERALLPETSCTRSAYITIMQGCDNFCAYCIVPYTRGRQKSRLSSHILAECRERVKEGALELILLGQNVNSWGQDLNENMDFAALLTQIADIPGVERIRFTASHPKDFSDRLVTCFSKLSSLCPRLHLPLQSGSDKILFAMGRKYNRLKYMRIIDKLRSSRPDMVFSTDLIVGFPGETEEDFADTLDLMKKCGFVDSYSFCYSDRPNTRAREMPDKISSDIQHERLSRLQDFQDALTGAWLKKRVGESVELLLEAPSARGGTNFWQGRDIYGAKVNVEMTASGDHAGEKCAVKITEAKKHSLMGKLIAHSR